MLDHSAQQWGWEAWLTPITRTATPTFIVIFGIMVEIVYRRKMTAGQTAQIRARMLHRALICYALFVLTQTPALITGKLGLGEFVLAIALQDSGRFGNILLVYAGMFAVLVFLMPAILRYGWRAPALVALLAALADAALRLAGMPDIYFVHVLLGYGQSGFGPAILTSLGCVAYGMAIGAWLTRRSAGGVIVLTLTAALALLAAVAIEVGPKEAVVAAVSWVARQQNQPIYYAYGLVGATAILIAFSGAVAVPAFERLTAIFAFLGSHTLFIYGFGNVALNALPAGTLGPLAVLPMAGFLALLFALAVDRARAESWVDRSLHGLPRRFERSGSERLRRIAERLGSPIPAPA